MKIKACVALFSVLIPLASHDTRAAPMGTTFTYQGRLTEVDAPANGLYDFSFVLHTNAVAAGSMVGAPVFTNAVAVSNGLVTVRLDFGAEVFAGEARWLEVGVRTNGAGQFVTLSPRQPLTPTPYALYAPSAGSAASAATAATATTATTAGTAGTAGSFTGSLEGDVTGRQSATVVAGIRTTQVSPSAPAADQFLRYDGSQWAPGAVALATDVTGTLADARLSANVALLNRNQTFTANQMFIGTNFFGNGSGIGQGRIIVNNGWGGVDTGPFTGFGLQYDNTFGEGALMSSFENGVAYLSFYTKPDRTNPVTKQMIISRYGDVAVDQANKNDGVLNNGTLAGAGLTFGTGSGEGIASKRTAGGNQYGLDFYTLFANRMSILNNGNVGIGTTAPGDKLEVAGAVRLDDNPVYLRAAGDRNHGLGFKDSVAGISFDGPFLWGYNGGALGTVGPDEVSLKWYYNGDVWISNHCSVASLRTRNASAGIGRDPAANALEVEGNASKTVAGGWLANSDARIKTDVHTVTNALDKLAQVRLVQFRYTDAYRAAHPSVGDREYLNVIAQEFQQVFPEAVQSGGEKLPNGDDVLQVDTYPLTIYSAAAIQALNQKVEAENSKLKQELGELRQLVDQLGARLNEVAK